MDYLTFVDFVTEKLYVEEIQLHVLLIIDAMYTCLLRGIRNEKC